MNLDKGTSIQETSALAYDSHGNAEGNWDDTMKTDQLDTFANTATGSELTERNLDMPDKGFGSNVFQGSDRKIWYDPETKKYMTNWELGLFGKKVGGKDREISERRYNKIQANMEKRYGANWNKAEISEENINEFERSAGFYRTRDGGVYEPEDYPNYELDDKIYNQLFADKINGEKGYPETPIMGLFGDDLLFEGEE